MKRRFDEQNMGVSAFCARDCAHQGTLETHVLTPEEDGALCRFMEYVERKYGCHDVEQSDV